MSAQPKYPSVPLDVWRPAFDAILSFRALAPWEWMFDCDICVLVDPAGTPWFASVLGMAREVRGLVLYRGAAGLRFLQAFAGDPDPDALIDIRFRQDALTVWFGAKSELRKEQRELYAELGFNPARGTKWAWPAVLDHTPGYVPWGPTTEQVEWLARAIPAATRFAALVRANPGVIAGRKRFEYPTVPLDGGAVLRPEELEWRHWRVDPAPVSGKPVDLDAVEEAAGLQALPVASDCTMDLGWFFMSDGIAEGDRPFHGRIIAVMDTDTAQCLGMEVIAIRDDLAQKAAAVLAGQFRRLGAIPERIRVQDAELAVRLGPALRVLGCTVERVERVESIATLREAMATFMGR